MANKKYKKINPRLTVQYINSDTEEILFEINDRTWMNVGELLTNDYVDRVVKTELEIMKKTPPVNLMVLVVGEYTLQ
jgi:hypothetical protein